MKKNNTITKFKCNICGKEEKIQTVYKLLVKECNDCFNKKEKQNENNTN